MKIKTFKISLAVADHVDYADVLDVVKTIADKTIGIYGIEIECVKPGEDGKRAPTSAANVPRKKRKYTRHVKPTEGDSKRTTASSPAEESGVKVTRRKMADGTTIENRGNCQGGGAV